MAGAGAKLFTDGSVLNAEQVNTYLMDQSIMRFATTSARDAAFGGVGEPTLAEGMMCYIDADNTIYTYDGTSWVKMVSASSPPAMELITSTTVTSVGGTAATVSNGVVSIGTSNTSVTIANAFSASFDNYRVMISGVAMSSGGGGLRFTLGSTFPSANWYAGGYYVNTSTPALTAVGNNNAGFINIGSTTSAYAYSNSFDVLLPFSLNRTYIPNVLSYAETAFVGQISAWHNADTSYNGFVIYPAAGSITGGQIRIYGYRNS